MIRVNFVLSFFKILIWGFVFPNLFACQRSSQPSNTEATYVESNQAPAIEKNSVVYSDVELLRGSLVVQIENRGQNQLEDEKRPCPAVLVKKNLIVLPRTCSITEDKNYTLVFTHPKTRDTSVAYTRLLPVASNSLSQSIGFQPRDYFLIYKVQSGVPDWMQPLSLLPPAQISQAFDSKKNLLILTADGVRSIKALDLKVGRFYIFPYVIQNLPTENLLLSTLAGRLYLTGGAKQVGQELFWVNLSSFTIIQEWIGRH